jgi:hypothetical protein
MVTARNGNDSSSDWKLKKKEFRREENGYSNSCSMGWLEIMWPKRRFS